MALTIFFSFSEFPNNSKEPVCQKWNSEVQSSSGSYHFFLPFPNSLITAKNRFVKNETAKFGIIILTEISGTPQEVILNIPVGWNRNGPSIWILTEISGIFGIMESTQDLCLTLYTIVLLNIVFRVPDKFARQGVKEELQWVNSH